ncbi:MAG TPA: hypothetical protein GX697_00925 [Firmicutes bacterium]|nr:hypothetical protein [Bacillota bacterium]
MLEWYSLHRDIRVAVIFLVNFLYSLSLMGAVFFYSLLGATATDRVELIITEATGLNRQEVLLSTFLKPTVLHNFCYVFIAGVFFCLICLFFFRQTFHTFFAPSIVTVLTFLFIFLVRNAVSFFLVPGTADATAYLYINNILERVFHAGMVLLIFGLLLFFMAFYGDKYLLKNKAARGRRQEEQ